MTTDESMLAWVDQLNDHMDCGCYDTITALAAEVRRCHARRCETCKHKEDGFNACTKTRADEYGWFEDCSVFGGGCLAWEKRDEV